MGSDPPDVSALAINVTIPEGLRWTDTRRGEEFTLTTLNVRLLPDGRTTAQIDRPSAGQTDASVLPDGQVGRYRQRADGEQFRSFLALILTCMSIVIVQLSDRARPRLKPRRALNVRHQGAPPRRHLGEEGRPGV
jgi:hypothetical protein